MHEVAGIGRQKRRDAGGGGMGAVRRAERVVDVCFAELGELLAELGIVLLLALVETKVLENQHLTILKGRCLGLGVWADGVGGERHGATEQLGEAQGRRAQRELLLEALARRTAEVAHEDDAGAFVDQFLDGGQRSADAGIVGADAICHGDVEVDADEHALAACVELVDGGDISHDDFLSNHRGCGDVQLKDPGPDAALQCSRPRSGHGRRSLQGAWFGSRALHSVKRLAD